MGTRRLPPLTKGQVSIYHPAMRAVSPVELAVVVSIAGSVLAASVPTFVRHVHASRMTEAVDGLSKIGAGAIAHAQGKELAASFPPPAELTPKDVPRGVAAEDPPGTWDSPTWQALGFRFDVPHRYAFQFDVVPDPSRIWFQATAKGDLNGDGILSTFALAGERRVGEQAVLIPGIYIEREVE
ncbi:MAG TPA: hypothetical protein PKL73_10140 [Polyangiaceae bacterium]|nr:MAG: hypothetical protein BWY17_03984 [Deltaproteobacteria bacterium ADurb.Bin207]HNS97298.1 hypothetical protein [Polyangiaceae bacterium]HNZ23498.1 hypothetical protein [Polyangiaceae bacterium]HOD23031.1 hypothetical protein [Polyangiaceae bacterium]HOE49582.1 hypothetical protein [Polyangiaceae bacterium]